MLTLKPNTCIKITEMSKQHLNLINDWWGVVWVDTHVYNNCLGEDHVQWAFVAKTTQDILGRFSFIHLKHMSCSQRLSRKSMIWELKGVSAFFFVSSFIVRSRDDQFGSLKLFFLYILPCNQLSLVNCTIVTSQTNNYMVWIWWKKDVNSLA